MEFRMAAAGKKSYIMDGDSLIEKRSVDKNELVSAPDADLELLLMNMVLNHTVVVDDKAKKGEAGGAIVYKASSPDEKAFVEAAAAMKIVFNGVDAEAALVRLVDFRGELRRFHVFHILDFDPTRKCMSVIVKDLKENQIILMTKGEGGFLSIL